MAHLYIPLDGVPIVPDPPGVDYIAADGWVVFSLSDRRFYAYNLALGIWQQAGGGIVVADTNSIDLTESSGTLSADVRISSDAASAGNVKATITIQSGASPGLLAVVSEADIKALFSVTDTDSVDLTYTSGATSADVRLSTNAADAGSQLVNLNIESLVSKGLRAQISNAAIQAALTVTDSDSIDLTYSGGAMSGDVLLSADSPALNYQAVELSIKTPATSKGLHAQIADSSIRNAISVSDTNSIDFGYGSGIISGDVRLSSDAADAGYTIVGLSIQSGVSKGLRAQVQNTAIQGLFSASAPVLYSAGVFSFDTATTALTKYLLLTGGTLTGQVYNNNGLTGTGTATTCIQPTAPHNVLNLQSTTLTFDVNYSPSYRITLAIANHPAMLVECCRHTAEITILSDQENLYLETDAGTGIYITKSAVSNTVTIKNRLGSTHNIFVLIERGLLTSATAWA